MVFTPDGTLSRSARTASSASGTSPPARRRRSCDAGQPDDLYGIAFSRDGKAAATSGYAGYVTVWNLADGKPTFSKKLKAFGAYCVAFTPDGKALVTGHDLLPGRNNANCYFTVIGAQ